MKKREHVFKLIDEYLFKQVDLAKSSPATQKLNEQLSVLSQQQQKYLNQAINLLLLLVPFTIVLIVFIGNASLKSEIDTKQQIFNIINTYASKKANVDNLSRSILSPTAVKSGPDLQSAISNSLRRSGADGSKIQVGFFDQLNPSASIVHSRAQVKFKSLTMTDLTALFTTLQRDLKVSIEKLEVNVFGEEKLLRGFVEVSHYNKVK